MVLFQSLDEHMEMKDISGKYIKAIKVFKLAFNSFFKDCIALGKNPVFPNAFDWRRQVMVLPSRFDGQTQLFLREAAIKVKRMKNVYKILMMFFIIDKILFNKQIKEINCRLREMQGCKKLKVFKCFPLLVDILPYTTKEKQNFYSLLRQDDSLPQNIW